MSHQSGDRRWPDFLLVGAPKAGTTALFRALSRHRDVFVSPEKEPRFFAFRGERPVFGGPGGERIARSVVFDDDAYLELFQACPPGKVAGEASTAYLHAADAPLNASACVPDARIIAVLRHPVDRGYSQWLHLRQEGLEEVADFERAWKLGAERAAAGWPPIWLYRERGRYGEQLQRWLRHFPANQVLVLFYEEWLEQPDETLARICRHLGIDDGILPRVTRENVSSRQPRWKWLHHRMVGDNAARRLAQRYLPLPVRDLVTWLVTGLNLRPGPRLDPELRSRLAVEFREDIKLLERLTEADLTHWRAP